MHKVSSLSFCNITPWFFPINILFITKETHQDTLLQLKLSIIFIGICLPGEYYNISHIVLYSRLGRGIWYYRNLGHSKLASAIRDMAIWDVTVPSKFLLWLTLMVQTKTCHIAMSKTAVISLPGVQMQIYIRNTCS